MNTRQWIIVAYLAVSALIQFGRGVAHQRRTYTMYDGITGLIEIAIIIWLVSSL